MNKQLRKPFPPEPIQTQKRIKISAGYNLFVHQHKLHVPSAPGWRFVRALLAIILCAWSGTGSVFAQSIGQGIVCQQAATDISKLHCEYRVITGSGFTIDAQTTSGQSLPVINHAPYPAAGQTTAILYLVDTSNPHRQVVVNKNAGLIQNLVAHAAAHVISGIAAFDSDFHQIAAIGSEAGVLDDAVAHLQARGATTEFYRNIITAVKLLGQTSTQRKVLVVFSDGLAEDKAYTHNDVIAAARQAGVEIIGVGYAASVLKATALQRLRRLAEDSSGLYQPAAADFTVPTDFIDKFYRYINRGGQFDVELSDLHGENEVILTLAQADANPMVYHQKVTLPAEKPAPSKNTYPELRIWLLLALIIALMTSVTLRRKMDAANTRRKQETVAEPTILAQIEVLDGQGSSIDIIKPVWRIGRSEGNDLQLSDVSISGFHAEIHQNRDGTFTITDLDSTNGVLVNEVPLRSHTLADQDLIELGNIRLRFHYIPTQQTDNLYGRDS